MGDTRDLGATRDWADEEFERVNAMSGVIGEPRHWIEALRAAYERGQQDQREYDPYGNPWDDA